MGLSISNFVTKFFGKQEYRILMVGLDGAGKTTILYKLKLGEIVSTIPTIGFNVETVEHNNINFTVWDIGGQDKLRCLWRHYFENTQGIIYVIDSSDSSRLQNSVNELRLMLEEHELRNAALLVLANKQDLPNAVPIDELINHLKLNEVKNRKWYVQGTCALKTSGLYEGLDWLSREVSRK